MAAIGFQVAAEVAAGVLIGLGIDYLAGTGRLWTIIGGVAGIAVGMLSLIRGTLVLNRRLVEIEKHKKLPKPLPADQEWNEGDDEDKG